MSYSKILARLRKENGYMQSQVADFLNEHSGSNYKNSAVSSWETGAAQPSNEHFLLLCELYGVTDIQKTFRGKVFQNRDFEKLNKSGKNRVQEYIAMLVGNPLFVEVAENDEDIIETRIIKLYDTPVAAGTGSFLDGDSYEEIEVDETVPKDADFAVRVSGDSMMPRYVDNQIVFIRQQETLEVGEIGIFELNGNSYIKKLGNGELLSLNPVHDPIPIREFDSLRVFGKVVG